MDKEINKKVLVLLLILFTINSFSQTIQYEYGSDYAKRLYHHLDSLRGNDTRNQQYLNSFINNYFVNRDSCVTIVCYDTKAINGFLSYERGSYIVEISNEFFYTKPIVKVIYYCGSGIMKKNCLIFQNNYYFLELKLIIRDISFDSIDLLNNDVLFSAIYYH